MTTAKTIGYARVSTNEQDLALQLDALLKAGAAEIVEDKLSGSRRDRPGLARALAMVSPGDTLAVWKLDRLGRSLPHLIEIAESIRDRGAHLKSVTEGIDTSTAGGRVLFHVLGALAEFERDVIRERTTAGMAAAKRAGKHVGRPGRMNAARMAEAWRMLDEGRTWSEVCRMLDISKTTLHEARKRWPKTKV